MRRILMTLAGLAVLCGAPYGYAAWQRGRWYAQDFRADFGRRMGPAVKPGSIQVIELSNGGRLVCATPAPGATPAWYGVRYVPTLFGGTVDVLVAPGQGADADEAYLRTACS